MDSMRTSITPSLPKDKDICLPMGTKLKIVREVPCFAYFSGKQRKMKIGMYLAETEELWMGADRYHVKPFLFGCIGGAAGALAAGVVHVTVRTYGITGLFAYLLDILAAAGVIFVVSWMLHREPPPLEAPKLAEGEADVEDDVPETKAETGVVYSPLKGKVVPIEEVPDDTFAAKILGDGMAVIPTEGKVYAPFDGTVEMVYDTGHAISMRSADGIELLIHIGINTVELDEKFYHIHVSDGDRIKKGDLLLVFDRKGIKEAGYSLATPVILTNSDDFDTIQLVGCGAVDNQNILMKI